MVGEDQESAVAGVSARGAQRRSCATGPQSEPSDTVVDQTPAAGQKVDEGSSVTLFVSEQPVREVPDVIG